MAIVFIRNYIDKFLYKIYAVVTCFMFVLPVFDNLLSQALPKTISVKTIIKGPTCKLIIHSHLPTGIKVVTSKGIGPIAFSMDMPTIAKIVKNTNLRFIIYKDYLFIALAKFRK